MDRGRGAVLDQNAEVEDPMTHLTGLWRGGLKLALLCLGTEIGGR
jgi:hypothetical protein